MGKKEEKRREAARTNELKFEEKVAKKNKKAKKELAKLSFAYDDEDGDEQVGGSLPLIPKKDMTRLISRGSAPAPRQSADMPSASEDDPSSRLSGFKFGRRLLESTDDVQ